MSLQIISIRKRDNDVVSFKSFSAILQQETQLSLRWADHTAYVWRPASDFRSKRKSDFL